LRTGHRYNACRHFVDIPVGSNTFDSVHQCASDNCIIAQLKRLKTELRCAVTDDGKREALKYVEHFVGDIHQPLHTIAEERGGNSVDVLIYMHGKACNGTCKLTPSPTNLHAAWDVGLIQKAVWN
jgi:nuclease S1